LRKHANKEEEEEEEADGADANCDEGGEKRRKKRQGQNSLLARVFIDFNLCTRPKNCYDN